MKLNVISISAAISLFLCSGQAAPMHASSDPPFSNADTGALDGSTQKLKQTVPNDADAHLQAREHLLLGGDGVPFLKSRPDTITAYPGEPFLPYKVKRNDGGQTVTSGGVGSTLDTTLDDDNND